MRAYLDNNILISIESNEINIDTFKALNQHCCYVYSYVHIQELMEAKHNYEELKKRRLKTIFDLTNNIYIYPDYDQIGTKIENPESIIQTINLFGGLMNQIRNSANNFNIDREKLISFIGINKKRINNYTPLEAIEYVNKAIQSKINLRFETFINFAGISLHERINTLFNFLDFIGFWKDKKTIRSNLARMYDASHTYFATSCDFFVSNDLRTRNKAKVVYKMYDIDTQVLSSDEFINKNMHKK